MGLRHGIVWLGKLCMDGWGMDGVRWYCYAARETKTEGNLDGLLAFSYSGHSLSHLLRLTHR